MFRASIIPLNKDILKQANSIIYKFVRKNKDKIKRLALISDYEYGGLRMPHIESMIDTQRILCLKKYVDKYPSPWKHFLTYILKSQGGKFIMHCNFSVTDLPRDLPKLYLECFVAWCKLAHNNILTEKHVLSEIIWNNRFLRIIKETVFSEKLVSKGILCIGDILSAQGKLQPWLFFKNKGLVLNDYLLLLGIYNSFPAPWKNILKSSDSTLTWQSIDPKDLDYNIYIDGENVKLEQLTTKKLYWTLVTNIQVPPSANKNSTIYLMAMPLTGKKFTWFHTRQP